MSIYSGMASFINCLIRNSRWTAASAIYIGSANVAISNCTLYRTEATTAGHGEIWLNNSSYTCTVVNCVIWSNTAVVIAGAVGTVINCSYSCVERGYAGTGNVTNNPGFVDSTYLHLKSRQGNYVNGYFSDGSWDRSSSDSPCLDTGDPASDRSKEPTAIIAHAFSGSALGQDV